MNHILKPLVLSLLTSTVLHAEDWPQWRGPNRDAVVTNPKSSVSRLPKEMKPLWQINVGQGCAGPVVAGNRLVYLDATNGMETAHCADAATGTVLWSLPFAKTARFENSYGDGPRCTPLLDGDRVYVQSCTGEFRCLAMADGKTLWRVNFETDYGATFLGNSSSNPEAKETAARRHGNNGSAAVDGDRIFVPVGSPKGATLVCFDKTTGKELWRAGNDNAAYSSVMMSTLCGTRQAVMLTADALMGVGATDGKILWRVPLKTNAKRHICTPVISGDTVTVASTTIGTIKFNISKTGDAFTATEAWKNAALKTIITTPVLIGDHLYTLGPGDKTDLVCLDFATGAQRWARPGFGDYAMMIALQKNVLVLNSTGELFLIKASPERYEELNRLQVSGKTWAFPAYADGRLYVKDNTRLKSIQISDGP